MVGNSQAQCQVDGTWEAAPTCQIVSKCKPFYNVSDYCRYNCFVWKRLASEYVSVTFERVDVSC